jgi:glycosyltransferase involved in cell wall biosynthesis
MKKRLAYFGVNYYPSRGGVSRITENIIRQLSNEFDITIYCFNNPVAQSYIAGVRTIQFKEPKIKELGTFIFLLKCFIHLLFFAKYDIVHVQKIDSSFFLPFLSLKYKNIIATSHESPYLRDKWSLFAKLYFKINERLFIHSKAKLTVISKPLSKYYKSRYKKDVAYIPNGVEPLKEFKSDEAKVLLNVNDVSGNFIVFAARRIMSTKGCHIMLKALQHIDYKENVVILGELTHSKEYIKNLIELSQGLNTHFLGYIGDKRLLMAIIKKAELFVFPSETEGMSIMLLEVASTGTPIIASDIPENTEIFNKDELVFFKNKDYIDLADRILFSIHNKSCMIRKAENAKAKTETHYSSFIMAENYRRLYNLF